MIQTPVTRDEIAAALERLGVDNGVSYVGFANMIIAEIQSMRRWDRIKLRDQQDHPSDYDGQS